MNMAKNIVVYSSRFDNHSHLFDEIEERFADKAMHHYASELLEKCLKDEQELETAMQRTMIALCGAHLSCREHVKKVFVSYGDSIRNDWLVSDLAFRLIIMNADVSNPIVARLQVEIVKDRQ
jgi:hypothetical protein